MTESPSDKPNRFKRAAAAAEAGGIRQNAHLLSDDTFLRESEVAVLLDMSPATLRNRRALGLPILPFTQLGSGTIRYRWGTVKAALAERTEQAVAI